MSPPKKIELPWDEKSFNKKANQAVSFYWKGREAQASKQTEAGRKDAGTRGEVTGGQHLNGFLRLFAQVASKAGIKKNEIHYS